jgi:prephenate dehydrogenase
VKLAFLGLGHIGGSIARAALEVGFASQVTAWTPAGTGPRSARAHGIVAAGDAGQALRDAQLVVLAAPPLACLDLLDELAGPLRSSLAQDAVITDVASTKAELVARARSHELRFVGGHPMAGREVAGYGASDPALVRDRPWVIVPADPADPAADERVAALAAACGARPVTLGAAEHDAAVAAISHLPLVLSVALVEAVTALPGWATAQGLAAGGWAGMTRLARGDAAMGAGILATNGSPVAARLVALRSVIDEWIGLLADGADPETLRLRLSAAQALAAARDAVDGAPDGIAATERSR